MNNICSVISEIFFKIWQQEMPPYDRLIQNTKIAPYFQKPRKGLTKKYSIFTQNLKHIFTVTSHFSDSPLFRQPTLPTTHYSDQLLNILHITPVHKITLKTCRFSVTVPPPPCTTKSDMSTADYS